MRRILSIHVPVPAARRHVFGPQVHNAGKTNLTGDIHLTTFSPPLPTLSPNPPGSPKHTLRRHLFRPASWLVIFEQQTVGHILHAAQCPHS